MTLSSIHYSRNSFNPHNNTGRQFYFPRFRHGKQSIAMIRISHRPQGYEAAELRFRTLQNVSSVCVLFQYVTVSLIIDELVDSSVDLFFVCVLL